MATDRPDVTESPYTVDAGHIQYESDLLRYKIHHDETVVNRQLLFSPFNLKIGILHNLDLQVGVETYRREVHEEERSHEKAKYSHTGAVTLRTKYNITGNDHGDFILAIMPYVKLPANRFFEHHRLEAGIIVPAQWKLSDQVSIGFQEEADRVAGKEEYAWQWLQSAVVAWQPLEQVELIAETYYTYDFSEKQLENYLNVAVQYNLTKNVAFDAGMLHGIQQHTGQDYYMGFSFRW